ncbi:MAG: HDOD domain-containing protein [Gammaproteobacteria bacterium]|nr:HDOD domain-containing protein [Gammaproteobacteria bacterium]
MSSFLDQLEQVTELISLPEVYLKIQRLIDDPSSDVDDFAKVISLDPSLTAKLLQVLNSAYYGFGQTIDSIPRAVNMLGIVQIHNMVLGISAMTALNFPNDIVPLKSFWRSSLFTGSLARELGRQMQLRTSDRLFIAGLLHEIGHLVLYTKFPELAEQSIDHARENNLSTAEAEQQVLGCHYGEIGAKLMEHWGLSAELINLTRHQPSPQSARQDQTEAAILHIAHAYAHQQFIDPQQDLEDMIDSSIWDMTRLTAESIEASVRSAQTNSAEMEKVILQ